MIYTEKRGVNVTCTTYRLLQLTESILKKWTMNWTKVQIGAFVLSCFLSVHYRSYVKVDTEQCPVSNNSFGSFWFSMVLVGTGFINCLASESFVVSFL